MGSDFTVYSKNLPNQLESQWTSKLEKDSNLTSNRSVQSLTSNLNQKTLVTLFPKPFLTPDYYLKFGEEKIFLKKSEIDEIKQIKEFKEFTLLGFKPESSLEWYHNLRSSIFIYPDNQQIKNSSIFCDAMIKELHSLKKIAICRFKPNEKRSYRMCALLPQLEQNLEGQHTPPGFNMVVLPFSEEIRKVEHEYFKQFDIALDNVKLNSHCDSLQSKYLQVLQDMKIQKKTKKEYAAVDTLNPAEREHFVNQLVDFNEQEQDCCHQLVEALTIEDFHPNYFENPEIQKFYKNLQALALNHEHVEQIEDHIQPDQEGLQINQNVIQHFTHVFGLNNLQKPLQRPKHNASNFGSKRLFKDNQTKPPTKSNNANHKSIQEEDVFLSDSL